MDVNTTVPDGTGETLVLAAVDDFNVVATDPLLLSLAYHALYGDDGAPPAVLPDTVAMPEDVDSLYSKFVFGSSAVPFEMDPHATLDLQIDVRRFVAGLCEVERDLLNLIYWGDRSQAEAAAALGVHPRLVSRMLARIHDKGREVIGSVHVAA
jgi:hypothetical protein